MRASPALALLLGVGCSAAAAPLAQPPPGTPEARATASALAPPPPAPSAPLAADDPVAAPAPTESAPAASLLVLEPPYSAQGHPSLATEMLTLARDEELFQWALGGSADPAHVSHQPNFHPATRVVVDVELQSRAPKGTSNKLLRIARRDGYWPLRACFEAAERLAPRRERSAKVRLTLGASGKVLGSRSLESSGERDYARCVLSLRRELSFRPGFTRKLDVDISVKQWPGHAPVPRRAPEQAAPLSLPPGVAAAFEAISPALMACYTQGLKADAGLWGRMAFHLTLDDAGRVVEAAPVETRFPNAEVLTCAHQALLGLQLPAPGVRELCFAFRLGQPPAPPPPIDAGAPAPPEPEPPIEPAH